MELASGYYSRGQYDTALDEVKLALAVKPDLPDAYNLRGLVYQSMGEDKLAEENFKRALQLVPAIRTSTTTTAGSCARTGAYPRRWRSSSRRAPRLDTPGCRAA